MADIGICGPANRPCKISHVSTYPNNVGIYPSQFLPSTFTIWHAVFASNFGLQPPNQDLVNLGSLGLAGGILAGAIGGGLFNIPGAITHSFQSHHYIIFARTANRFSVAYTVTQDDIDAVNAQGIGQIDIGEYVFEAVSVTIEPLEDIDTLLELTDAEKEALEDDPNCTKGCSPESEEDRKFRKLFEISIANNKLLGVVVNTLGVEFRLDNGSRKSGQGLNQAGLGDLDNASYRDGTSRKLEVRFTSGGENPAPGDIEVDQVIYLTYVAVKEHYMRQRINVGWNVFDPGDPTLCITTTTGFNAAHFRFFEWDMEPEGNSALPQKLAGWRAVEAFSSDVSFVAAMQQGDNVLLGDFLIGGFEAPGIRTTPVLRSLNNNTSKVSISELQAFIDDRNTLSRFEFDNKYGVDINLTDITNNGSFHVNTSQAGTASVVTSEWFQRNIFTKFTNRIDASNHVFYNVHPKALRKRDIDKWAIERSMAEEILKDIETGNLTFFPFMDDPDVINPTSGTNENLNATNTIFAPIQPTTSYGGNFFADCQSLGTFPTNPADGLNSVHSVESNKISERFEKDTQVLVEKNFAVGAGQLGPNLITLEGAGGVRGGTVTCIADPSGEFAFSGHGSDDGFLAYNKFSTGYTNRGINKLTYRPDQSAPPIKQNTNPATTQFEKLLGFSSVLGDAPGIQPGQVVSISNFAPLDVLTFKTTSPELVKTQNPDLEDDQVEEMTVSQAASLVVPVANGFYGSITINYELPVSADSKSADALLLAKVGGNQSGIVDTLTIRADGKKLQILFRWIKADSFELIGERVEDMQIKDVIVKGILPDKANDFLNEGSSHGQNAADQSLAERLADRSLLFSTDVMTLSEDENSVLYMFFNDADGGISVAASTDFGDSWTYHYGIVEKINGNEATNPFAVTEFQSNACFLFYQMAGKILCKKIHFRLFQNSDSNLIERLGDILTPANEDDSDSVALQSPSVYTDVGQILRRRVLSYVARGDLTDEAFLELLGRVPGQTTFDIFETRQINGQDVKVRKQPLGKSPGTAFTNRDQQDTFFSAYRNDVGELKLWFLGDTVDGPELQCHFSVDDGQTWYDLWEYLDFGYNRLRYDPNNNSQFIDRGASAEAPTTLEGNNPLESNQIALFGINVHWSRLKRHKIEEGDTTIDSESKVLNISSPYVFYQPTTDKVFLFYIYEGCLLCKIFNDATFATSARNRSDQENGGFSFVQNIIERQTRAYFVDGALASSSIQEELHRFVQGEERMAEGNIIFRYPFAVDAFGDDRVISAQRVCAFDLPNSLVRVLYKHGDTANIKSAIWTGAEWWAEDFLKDPTNLPSFNFPDNEGVALVTGGFGGTGFV